MTILRSPTLIDSAPPGPLETGADRSGWRLSALALAMLLPSLGTSIANVALPSLAAEFGAPIRDVQWVVIIYLLAVTTLVVTAGRLGDLCGRRRLLLGGIAVFALASACCALAPSLWLLIAARGVQGAGAALLMALTIAAVVEVAPQRTGSAVGLLGTVSAVGTALGPSLGGVLVEAYGWQAPFVFMAVAGAASLLIGYLLLPAGAATEPARQPLDLWGMALLAVTIGAYALGMTRGSATGALLLIVAAVGLAAFVRIERSVPAPLLRIDLLRHPVLSTRLMTIGIASAIVMATLVVGPFYLSASLGLEPVQVGLVLAVGPSVAALAGVPAGRLSDRVGASRMSLAGLAVMALGSAAMALLSAATGGAGYVAALGLITAGYALVQAATTSSVLQGAEPGQRGVVSGLLALARNLGLITGASAMGALYAFGARGTAEAGASGERGLLLAFGVATVLASAALVLAWWVSRPRTGDASIPPLPPNP